MSVWKRLSEMIDEAGWNTGWRRNSIWDRAQELDRRPTAQPSKPAGKEQGPPTGQVVWRGASMRDNDLFQMKKDKKTGQQAESGLIPALKQAGGTISRAPDGSGIAVSPRGYKIDPSVWKDWSPTRSKALIDATTGGRGETRSAYDLKGGQAGTRTRTPNLDKNPAGATKLYDVLMQGMQTDTGIMVTKVVWAPYNANSISDMDPDARQGKLDLLADTDDPAELAQMFPAGPEPQQGGLGKPPRPAWRSFDDDEDPAPTKDPFASAPKKGVQWTKGNAPAPAARPSSWDDIDLNRVPPEKKK